MRVRWEVRLPAESRSAGGFGGHGAINFYWHASAAVAYSPKGAERASIIHAIGRGIGRAAIHEFAHLLLPRASIDDSADIGSYEYRSAARREQYFGELHWVVCGRCWSTASRLARNEPRSLLRRSTEFAASRVIV